MINKIHRKDIEFIDISSHVSQYYIQATHESLDIRSFFIRISIPHRNMWFEYAMPDKCNVKCSGVWRLEAVPEEMLGQSFAVNIQQTTFSDDVEKVDASEKSILKSLSKGVSFWSAPFYRQLVTLYGRENDGKTCSSMLEITVYIDKSGKCLGSVIMSDSGDVDEDVLIRMYLYPVWDYLSGLEECIQPERSSNIILSQ